MLQIDTFPRTPAKTAILGALLLIGATQQASALDPAYGAVVDLFNLAPYTFTGQRAAASACRQLKVSAGEDRVLAALDVNGLEGDANLGRFARPERRAQTLQGVLEGRAVERSFWVRVGGWRRRATTPDRSCGGSGSPPSSR